MSIRIFFEDEGFYTLRETMEDPKTGECLVSINPLFPLAESYDELKKDLMEYIEAFNEPTLHEKDVGYFAVEFVEDMH